MSQFIPRPEINVDEFLRDHPKFDGRDVVIAIWDTGIDPTAAGLQVTPTGQRKILDLIDASGSGDVKMTAERKLESESRELITLSGRKVQVPPHWKPANGIIRLGVKLASELFPSSVLQRLRSDDKNYYWRPCVEGLAADLASCKTHCSTDVEPDLSEADRDKVHSSVNSNSTTFKNGQRTSIKGQTRADTQLFEECLTAFDRHYSQLDPVYDCFLFSDGTDWIACVDTSPYEEGKTLADMPLLMDYTVKQDVACFGQGTQLYYTVKILDDGDCLQIVTNNSGHGTHVAAITAAYFPPSHSDRIRGDDGSEECRDGVAPGAQLVGIKISDSRLGTMETGISLLRAMRWTVDLKCDVVNYSFGEYCMWPNIGRVCKHLRELVTVHGVVFVGSGGNNGPGLGTLSCPGATIHDLIGVAPVVYPNMMRSMYCQPFEVNCEMENNHNNDSDCCPPDDDAAAAGARPSGATESPIRALPIAYTWGSRGPAVDGAVGLCVAAPGAANTSVPAWQLRPTALLNGSSMSAPMVAGCIGLLLSGLRQSRTTDSRDSPFRVPPALIRLALENTAAPIPHLTVLDQGRGVVQVDKAFDYLIKALDCADRLSSVRPMTHLRDPCVQFGWRLRCTVSGPGCLGPHHRGIWLRHGLTPPLSQSVAHGSRPLLRYAVQFNVDFDQHVPFEFRRQFELNLVPSTQSNWYSLQNRDSPNATRNLHTQPLPWLHLAKSISVTGAGREIHLIIDPNKFAPSPRSQPQAEPSTESADTMPTAAPLPATDPVITVVNFSAAQLEELGVLTQFPITIHRPIALPYPRGTDHPRFALAAQFDASHKVRRWFLAVPTGATAGILRLARVDNIDSSCTFKVTVNMPQHGLLPSNQEVTWPLISLAQAGTNQQSRTGVSPRLVDDVDGICQLVFQIPWEADCLELTIVQHWGLEFPASLNGTLVFRGLEPSMQQVTLCTSDQCARLALRSNFVTESIAPTVSLTHWVLPLRPTDFRPIAYLGHGKNEVLLTGRGCYALRLTYEFACPFKSSLTHFELPWLHELLYENDYVLQLYHVYDTRGRFVGAGEYDVKHPKKSKFAVSLNKGNYKVLVQICHEKGPNLSTTLPKPASPDNSSSHTLDHDHLSGLTGGDVISGETAPPLDRLLQYPALVSFRLPNANPSNPSGSPVGRQSVGMATRSHSNVAVTFEFAAFPFSLGLNGAKPCSAYDPLPPPTGQLYAQDGPQSVDTVAGFEQAGETNRRCPCLPASLLAMESTALYIGLANQRYPSYACRGSYFVGSIGFYASDLLQNVVTYPFRLNVDSVPVPRPSPSGKKPRDQHESASTPPPLLVGSLGLSVEDFAWLGPLERVLGVSSESGPSTHPGTQLSAGVDLGADEDRRCSSNAMGAEPPTNNSIEPVDHLKAGPVDGPDVSLSESDTTGLHMQADETPSALPVTPAAVPADSDTTTKQTISLSKQLCDIHESLVSIDTPPLPASCSTDMHTLLRLRASVWSEAHRLIVGRDLDSPASTFAPNDLTDNPTRTTFLYHLLTMRLVTHSTAAKPDSSPVPEDSTSSPSANGSVPRTETNQSDSVSENLVAECKERKHNTPRSRGSTVFTYAELKVRLIDTLARYGRLLCEQLLCTHNPAGLARTDLPECHHVLDRIHTRLLPLITKTCTASTESIGQTVRFGSHAIPSWLLISGLRNRHAAKVDRADEATCRRVSCSGSIGGRVLIFLLLSALVRRQYAPALRLLTGIVYQADDPPTAAHSGSSTGGQPSSLGQLRPVTASSEGTNDTARLGLQWLLWLLRHLGWHTLARSLQRQAPMQFPQRDYTLMYDPDLGL